MTERRIKVAAGPRPYPIAIRTGLIEEVGERVQRAMKGRLRTALVISNPTVFALYGRDLVRGLETASVRSCVHLVRDGERYKTLAEVERAIGAGIAAGLERGEPVIALGGGVIGDTAGLVAALFMRGTPVVQVPTTLLAQIDSAIGGKVGVNHADGKNLIGAFHQPLAVFADPATISTLPQREVRAGLFEAVKYGIIMDATLFERMPARLADLRGADPDALAWLVERCCRSKRDIVERDEREHGVRRYLNLGHTAGHALETVTRYRRFRHGEAVGYGLEIAAEISAGRRWLSRDDCSRIRQLVQSIGRRPSMKDLDPAALIAAMQHDKKRAGGRLGYVLPRAIGQVVFVQDVTDTELRHAIGAVAAGSRV